MQRINWPATVLFSLISLSAGGKYAVAAPADATAGRYDVRTFGAKGDGVALDTAAINKAIDAAAEAGGGTVCLTAGSYLSTSVHLKSNITLDLEPGATLVAAKPSPAEGYDAAEPNPAAGEFQDFGHTHWHNSLIWGENLHDIAIVGSGRILGTGLTRTESKDPAAGNKSISLKLCRNVTLRDFTIQHGGWFGILATGVDNLTISNLKIDTNRDGMDIDCCRNVHVSDCSVNSPHDDGICLKSSFGLGFNRATENVTITNCEVSGYSEGTFLDGTYERRSGPGTGRIKFGTEANGGYKNIAISNCVFDYCLGLALEEVDGGNLENVTISNLTMRDIGNAPIYLRLAGRLRAPKGTSMGALRRISISHVIVYDANPKYSVIITGIPGFSIEDVDLSDIHLWFKGGGTAEQAALVSKEDVTGYPEPNRLGIMPAYGFYIRHARGITLRDIQLRTTASDLRPAIVLDDVHGLHITGLDAQHAPSVPIFALKGVTDLSLRDVHGLPDGHKDTADDGTM